MHLTDVKRVETKHSSCRIFLLSASSGQVRTGRRVRKEKNGLTRQQEKGTTARCRKGDGGSADGHVGTSESERKVTLGEGAEEAEGRAPLCLSSPPNATHVRGLGNNESPSQWKRQQRYRVRAGPSL